MISSGNLGSKEKDAQKEESHFSEGETSSSNRFSRHSSQVERLVGEEEELHWPPSSRSSTPVRGGIRSISNHSSPSRAPCSFGSSEGSSQASHYSGVHQQPPSQQAPPRVANSRMMMSPSRGNMSSTSGASGSTTRRRIFIGIGVLSVGYFALIGPNGMLRIFGAASPSSQEGQIPSEHTTPGGFYGNNQNQALMNKSTQNAMMQQQQEQEQQQQEQEQQQHEQHQQQNQQEVQQKIQGQYYQQQDQQQEPAGAAQDVDSSQQQPQAISQQPLLSNAPPPNVGDVARKDEEEEEDLPTDEKVLEKELLEEEKVEEAEEEDLSEEQNFHRLECRDSVMEFVINASDQKDECDGLRRAFDAACTNLDMAESIFNPAAAAQNVVVHAQSYNPKLDHINPNLLPPDQRQPHAKSRSEDIWGPASRGPVRRGGGDSDWDTRWDSTQTQQELDPHAKQHSSLMGKKLSQSIQHDKSYWGVVSWLTNTFQEKNDERKDEDPWEEDDHIKHESALSSDYYLESESADEFSEEFVQDGYEEEDPVSRGRKLQISPAIPSSNEHPGSLVQQGAIPTSGKTRQPGAAIGGPYNQRERPFVPRSRPSQLYSHAQSILESPESIEARTCCASILNVFHEHCDRNEEVEYTDRSLFVIVSVIALCGIVKSLIRYYEIRWLPEAGGCILVGAVLGYIIESMPKVHFSFDGSLFLRVMLPFIVFHAALSIDKQALYELIVPIMVYACFGTFMSSALVAIIIHVGTAFGMPGRESFIFGALISSIDPIAILSVLSSIGMSNTDAIYVIIFGESLFNDGVAIVLYETLIEFLDESVEIDGGEIWNATVHFVVVMIGSTLVGVLSGVCCTIYFYAMRGCQTPLVEVLIFICWALIPYYICDGLSWSGIVGIIAASIVMDMYVVGAIKPESHVSLDVAPSTPPRAAYKDSASFHGNDNMGGNHSDLDDINAMPSPSTRENRNRIFTRTGHLSAVARTHIGFVSEINATLMETSIFAYLGLFLLSARYKWNTYLTVLAILSCLASRAVMIPALSFFLNKFCGRTRRSNQQASSNGGKTNGGIPYANGESGDASSPSQRRSQQNKVVDARMQVVMWFGGLRGAMSFALVENIPLYDASTGFGSRLKPELKAMTSASIIFSVFVCGGSTYYLLEKLGMTPKSGSNGSRHGGGDDESFMELQPLAAQGTASKRRSDLPSPQNHVKASPEPLERKEKSPGFSADHFHNFSTSRDAPKLSNGGVRHR